MSISTWLNNLKLSFHRNIRDNCKKKVFINCPFKVPKYVESIIWPSYILRRTNIKKISQLFPSVVFLVFWCYFLAFLARNSYRLGTIHKQCWQFFLIFDTSLPHVAIFLVLHIHQQFWLTFDPSTPPCQIPTSFMDGPLWWKLWYWKVFINKNVLLAVLN